MSSTLYIFSRKKRRGIARLNYAAASNIFSIKMPYPVVGSLTRTWVTAPTSLPSWMMGERPDRCRWQKKGGERVAAVDKIEEKRKPEDFIGHRNRRRCVTVCGALCAPCRRCGCVAHRPRHLLARSLHLPSGSARVRNPQFKPPPRDPSRRALSFLRSYLLRILVLLCLKSCVAI